jgi:hypothetical protein
MKKLRELTAHQIHGQYKELEVSVLDDHDKDGICHRYEISGFDTLTNESRLGVKDCVPRFTQQLILFQNGHVCSKGLNGFTQEVLLAIIKDRIEGFQSGPMACEYNAKALEHVNKALDCLKQRAISRIQRGVDGKKIA